MLEAICAPATPLLPSAVAIVRVSGTGLSDRLKGLLRLPAPREARVRTVAWDGFREKALVLFFPAPGSYTGEDLVEFHLHGNPLLVKRLLEHLGARGIRLAEPGEFTRRALLNGRQGLLEAEALRDLVNAATDTQVRQAQARAGGAPAWVAQSKAILAPWLARAEAAVDYGEEEGIGLDLDDLRVDLDGLRRMFHVERERAAAARWLLDGIRVALVGRPNAGKSTLFNALAGADRAIVTDLPGTTRDVLEVRTQWAGLPLFLFDTAGLRTSEDPVERLGVARVGAVLEEADVILHLVPLPDPAPDPEVLARLGPLRREGADRAQPGRPGRGARGARRGGTVHFGPGRRPGTSGRGPAGTVPGRPGAGCLPGRTGHPSPAGAAGRPGGAGGPAGRAGAGRAPGTGRLGPPGSLGPAGPAHRRRPGGDRPGPGVLGLLPGEVAALP